MNTLTQVFEWLVTASLRASLLTVAVLIIQTMLGCRLAARWRYTLWLPVLVAVLMPVLPQSRWSVGSVLPSPPIIPVASTTVSIAPSNQIPTFTESSPAASASLDWKITTLIAWLAVATGIVVTGGTSFLLMLHRFQRSPQPVSERLLSTLAEIAGEVRLRRLPRICLSPAIAGPAVTGLWRPTLLLPADFEGAFTPAESRLVLKHELMHLKRGDLPLNALLCLLMALHWFNPVLWLAFFKARIDREAACDAQVLSSSQGDCRLEYGHALLKVESSFHPRNLSLGFVGILQRGAALRARIRAISRHHPAHPAINAIAGLCVGLLTFLGITRAQDPVAPRDTGTGVDLTGDVTPQDAGPLIAIEVKILKFNSATDWDFEGRLKSVPKSPDATETRLAVTQMRSDELNLLLRDILKRQEVTTTSWPRMVSRPDKEVMIRSVVNQPYRDKKGAIDYLALGFVAKFLPKIHDRQIRMNTEFTDSELFDPATGAKISEPKENDVHARSRVFRSELEFQPGQSSLIYGWVDGDPRTRRPIIFVVTPTVIPAADAKAEAASPEADVAALRAQPAQTYQFLKANLWDVVRFLARDAGIKLQPLPDDLPEAGNLLTFSLKCSPFHALETIAESNGLALEEKAGVWTLRSAGARRQDEAERLRAMPARKYEFKKAMLGDVLRFLGTEAGISFFSLPDDHPATRRLIDLTTNTSPFAALDLVVRREGLELILSNDIWRFTTPKASR